MIRYWDKTSETQKGSSTKWFGTETKLFWRKILIPAPFLNPNIFDTRNFPKQGFLYEIFRYCETKFLT